MNNIIELRIQREILKREQALDLNLTQEAISSYETERVTPSADVLIKLADYFNTNIDYLLCRTKYNLPILIKFNPSIYLIYYSTELSFFIINI